jgi:O-antigen/teichoic acid export membrane protein
MRVKFDSREAVDPDPLVGDITPPGPSAVEGVPTDGRRVRAARGVVVNTGFLIGLQLLALLKGFLIAGFITVSEYGVWGLILASSAALFGLAQIGINDKYIQQDASDQKAAFQLAFTLQLGLSLIFVVLFVVTMPLFALAYGNWDIVLPGWALALALPSTAFQTPLWTFYKRMEYMRQRQIQAIEPVLSIVIALVLAIQGFGYWSLVIGAVIGPWAAALVAVRASPYPLGIRYERGTLREYWTFSGPLLFQGFCISVIALTPTLAAQRALGVAAVGAMAIANNISQYTTKVDRIVTGTLYPVVCAVRHRRDLMQEAFLKSNKLGMLWGAPSGLAIVLFAPDIINFAIGDRWRSAIPVIQAYGAVAVLNQIMVNWTVFYRALGNTRPIAVGGAVMAAGAAGIATPLLLAEGLVGFAFGYGIAVALYMFVRLYYLNKLFSLPLILRNIMRGMIPGLTAFLVTGGVRLLIDLDRRTELAAIAEVVLFGVIAIALTFALERRLLGEMVAYLRKRRPGAVADVPAA